MAPERSHPAPATGVVQTSQGRLDYQRSGAGSPVWLMFNGAGVTLSGWRGIQPGLAAHGTVLAWNRFGLGRSDPPRGPQSAARVVAALDELLQSLGLAPPYLLVGHSLGALHARFFACLHPQQVQGLALIEPSDPTEAAPAAQEPRVLAALSRLFAAPRARLRANLHAELQAQAQTACELASCGPLPPVPLRVISGGRAPPRWLADARALAMRHAHHEWLARLSPQGARVIASGSGHFPQKSEPDKVLQVLIAMAGER